MPSRLIISSVNRNTPDKRAERRSAAPWTCRCCSISPFMRRPARHMWTVSDVTDTAATMASGPSSHS